DLPGVARIGDRLLVPRHRGVEDDLADAGMGVAQLAVEARSVFQKHVAGAGRRQLGAEGHRATPIAKLRSLYATAPPATVISTRPVKVRPANAQFDERLS